MVRLLIGGVDVAGAVAVRQQPLTHINQMCLHYLLGWGRQHFLNGRYLFLAAHAQEESMRVGDCRV
jgi:hypothetical protein